MSMAVNLKISVSGVRGIAGDSLTPSLVANFASAFGQYVGGGAVLIARDSRPHGEIFEHAVISGLISVGVRPVLVGIMPTPSAQIAVDAWKLNGGIVISASHNPIEWNALKFISRAGVFLNNVEASELIDIYNQPGNGFLSENDYKEPKRSDGAFEIHKARILEKINLDALKKRGFRVAVDSCNGAGAPFIKQFLSELACESVAINTETDGIFRRKPEPVAENIGELCEIVKREHCDVGFAQDPDADRLTIVDQNGKTVGEQYSFALALSQIVKKRKGNVIVNLDTTKAVEDIASQASCPLFYTKVGEINVTSEIISKKAVAGGEGGSGGVIWPAIHPCRDSFGGMALILEMMAESGKSISELNAGLPQYHMVRRKIRTHSGASSQEILRILKKKYSDLKPNTLDGFRLDWPDRWILARSSNTEPIIRISAEASDRAAAESLADEFSQEVNNLSP